MEAKAHSRAGQGYVLKRAGAQLPRAHFNAALSFRLFFSSLLIPLTVTRVVLPLAARAKKFHHFQILFFS